MKTYPMKIIREAFLLLIDRKKYVKFTVYAEKSRPLKIKAKINNIWGTPKGLKIVFYKAHFNTNLYFGEFSNCGFYVRDIRWITPPFKIEMLETVCQQLI